MDLQLRLLEEIRILEKIEQVEDKVASFKSTRNVIQELYNNTTLGRRELKFVLNSLRGLIEGFEVFTPQEVTFEVQTILTRLLDIKEHLTGYLRNNTFKVPEGSSYLDLEPEHFLRLAKLQGPGRVVKSLIELKWDEPSLAPWADSLIEVIQRHKNDIIHQRGSFKDQLASLKSIGIGGDAEALEGSGTSAEGVNYLQKWSKIPRQLLEPSEDRGWIRCPVFISCFDRVVLRKLRELGYRLKSFAGEYVAIQSAQCFGLHTRFAESIAEASRVMAPYVSKPLTPVGSPVFCSAHYYWLCFEFPLVDSIKMWNFL